MKSIYKVFIIVFCCSIACSKKTITPTVSYRLELTPVDTTLFLGATDVSKLFYHYDEINDKEYLVAYNSSKYNFIVFDYTNGDVISDFDMDTGINSLHIKTIDSIYIGFNNAFKEKGNVFGIVNSNGDAIKKINLNNIMVIPDIDSNGNFNLLGNKNIIHLADNPYSFDNFCILDETMYMNVITKDKKIPNKYDYPILAFITLNNDMILKYDYHFPTSYKNSKVSADYVDFVIKKDKKNIINIIISYVLSDSVHINRLVPKFESNDISLFSDNPDYDSLIIKNVASKYRDVNYNESKTRSPHTNNHLSFKYIYLKYDEFRNCFYRIAVHSPISADITENMEYYKSAAATGMPALAAKVQNWSIIVSDENLNPICEKIMLAAGNYYPNILVTKNGMGLIDVSNINNKGVVNDIRIVKNSIRLVKQ